MRRRIAAVALLAVLGSAVAAPARAALPTVDMEAVIKAAQIDPRRPDTALTPGAQASVLQVEQALDAKNLLDPAYVDGHFGTKTVEAYAAYQRSLGYSGLDASGLPGRTSLQLLGDGRYTVTNTITPGSRVTYRGVTVNTRTKTMLAAAETLLSRTFVLTQGSYNAGGDPASAGTHDGGGVVDISVSGMSGATRTNVVRALRQVGFAAWLRTPAQADWPYHIHAVAISDTDQSPQAQHQAGDYYLGQNGLANRGPDDGPQVPKVTWEEHQRA
ncbi:peptidoglycan-binding domain-containing protein [Actinomadura atramentaria]|uniref:peptidoglycan-binding domain-containing protein n=1 Tax=Actinomadura atramentaria TaxID=1990 RepID=UPI000373AB03|nr:hypothetical protein [Actinomadura atramentaria]